MSDQPRFQPGGTYVYETPDHGRSVYAREIGSGERFLIGRRMDQQDFVSDEVWKDVLRLSKLHSNLAEEVERILTLYYLLQQNNTGDVQWHPV